MVVKRESEPRENVQMPHAAGTVRGLWVDRGRDAEVVLCAFGG